jgi:hypothetical protein
LQGNADLARALFTDPKALAAQLAQAAISLGAHPSKIPGMVSNAMHNMWSQASSSPEGLGEVVGANIDPRNWLKPGKALRKELDVYHGTPHRFPSVENNPLGAFDANKIGTGEGAQVYGRGLYFAENPNVAKTYNPNQSIVDYKKSTAYWQKDLLSDNPARVTQAKNELAIIDQKLAAREGSLYKVDLPDAKIEQMLDWDKPLSEQPPRVRDALLSNSAIAAEVQRINEQRVRLNEQNPARLSHPVVGKLASKETTIDSLKGQAIYELLAKGRNQAQASEYLRSLGIPGIKYLDQGSRAVEKGTRNFVVFPGEEQHLNILSRN